MKLEYKIVDIRTDSRRPGIIYANIIDENGGLCVSATLDYCVTWIRREVEGNREYDPEYARALDEHLSESWGGKF